MSRSGLFNFDNEPIWIIHGSHSFFFKIFLVELCRLFEMLRLKYSNGTGYSRYSRSSCCSGLLSGARDAERPTSSKCRHDCRLPGGPGTRIIAHDKPDQRASWDPHEFDCYYLGPALDHYRCYQVHITKTKGTRIVDTVEFPPAKLAMPSTSSKDLASIAALEISNALQNPAPAAPFSQIYTVQLQSLRQLLDIFSAALPSGTSQHAPQLSQNSSQFRSTVQQGTANPTRMPRQPIPPTPFCSPSLDPRRYQRVLPIQVPSPRVTPRFNSSHVAPLRVSTPLPPTTVIPLTPHPASVNVPYILQGTAGVNLFDTFEEEHMTTPTVPRYSTRALARQHSAHQAQTLTPPRIFRPIAFTTYQNIPMPMANSVINEDTGASLEYRHLIKDDSTFTV
jgi:hypothetical protein